MSMISVTAILLANLPTRRVYSVEIFTLYALIFDEICLNP